MKITRQGQHSDVFTLKIGRTVFDLTASQAHHTVHIENPRKYLEGELPDFENNLKLFIKSGRYSFLLNDEPFYFHCMRYYLPTIARQTFHSFQLGLGIFNMQGFERRNKESKTLLHRACNNKRSSKAMLRNNIRRLLINFWYQ
jgi:hypothetical protein